MKKFTTIPKIVAVAAVIGAMGFAYAQSSGSRTATDIDPTTGTATQRSNSANPNTTGTTSNTTTGRMNDGSNMGSGSTTSNTAGTNMERPARADRN